MKPDVRFLRAIDDAEAALKVLRSAGPALLVRDREVARADGFPQSSLGPEGGGRSDPTLGGSTAAAALATPYADPIHELALRMVDLAVKAATDLRDAQAVTQKAKAISTVDGRFSNGPVDCLACDRTIMCTPTDRPVGGYCRACDSAWRRWRALEQAAGRCMGDPGADRLRFERWRRSVLAKDAEPRPCGHACCDRAEIHSHFHEPAACPECIALLAEAMP